MNAVDLAETNPGLRVVIGTARGMGRGAGGTALFGRVVPHAWVVDGDGSAWEVTWDEPGVDYLGTEL